MFVAKSKLENIKFVRDLVSQEYFNAKATDIVRFEQGFNVIYRIAYNKKTYLLKIYPSEKCQRIIQCESFFRNKGLSIIPAVQSICHEYCVTIDNNYKGILYPFINAKLFIRRNSKRVKTLGSILGKLHLYGKCDIRNVTQRQDLFRQQDIEDCLIKLYRLESKIKSPFVRNGISYKINVIKKNKKLISRVTMPANNCLVHGDFHQRNVMFDNHNYYLFDFENSHYGISELDLVRTAFSICFKGTFEKKQFEYFKFFIAGYSSIAPKINKNVFVEAVLYYFLNNLLGNCFYEEKLLNQELNSGKLLSIFQSQVKTIKYLDDNLEYFTNNLMNTILKS